jgi:glutamine synthetase
VAAILAGIAYGIEKKLDCSAETVGGDEGTMPDPKIPFAFLPALDRLAKAKILPDYIEPECLRLYVDAKRAESEKFMGAISRQEYDWYL